MPSSAPTGTAQILAAIFAREVKASRTQLSLSTTPRSLARMRAANISGERSSSGGGMDGGIELIVRTADDAELKPSSDSVMGIGPPFFFYRFLLFLPTCRWSFTAALRDGERLCYSARAFGPACDYVTRRGPSAPPAMMMVGDTDAKKSSRAGIDRPLPTPSMIFIHR
jgi:hypothetical protein